MSAGWGPFKVEIDVEVLNDIINCEKILFVKKISSLAHNIVILARNEGIIPVGCFTGPLNGKSRRVFSNQADRRLLETVQGGENFPFDNLISLRTTSLPSTLRVRAGVG